MSRVCVHFRDTYFSLVPSLLPHLPLCLCVDRLGDNLQKDITKIMLYMSALFRSFFPLWSVSFLPMHIPFPLPSSPPSQICVFLRVCVIANEIAVQLIFTRARSPAPTHVRIHVWGIGPLFHKFGS